MELPAATKPTNANFVRVIRKKCSMNYFTSSDPHHDMLGGGCQVRVVIENMMGRMENLRTLISGFLGLVILVRWALVTMFPFLNYSDRLPHPSDLCQPDRVR